MEPNNNFYVYHKGNGIETPRKSFLFVFPLTESLTWGTMQRYVISAFCGKYKRLLDRGPKYHDAWYNHLGPMQGREWYGSKKAFAAVYSDISSTSLNFHPLANATARWMTGCNITSLESNMNELIRQYETLTAATPALKLGRVLTAKNIYYYDERKVLGGYTFDKRSPEGVEYIKAKLVVKREKLLAQRTHSANAKRRNQCIEVSRQALQVE
ncbi:hypothetical protein GGH94_003564 [Coemansia aciculifera]|uniref:Uncharacterized protein n=2 Tax=Coemansia TaxID=4863 RepID=A0A9W8LAF4_9FUNG|nr:hypothetical protein GGI19_003303 [Coemansia pectinata]KAJ2863519.1 hypothetical protein GGH94_003564 [Coemansia aciculifera]KAJ2873160.1 hypothetical protein GGH93_003463 [Coemansia aciculifera]KAJ2885119.1 hypothetical protein H4R27_001610 [Coemansia aciculifera]